MQAFCLDRRALRFAAGSTSFRYQGFCVPETQTNSAREKGTGPWPVPRFRFGLRKKSLLGLCAREKGTGPWPVPRFRFGLRKKSLLGLCRSGFEGVEVLRQSRLLVRCVVLVDDPFGGGGVDDGHGLGQKFFCRFCVARCQSCVELADGRLDGRFDHAVLRILLFVHDHALLRGFDVRHFASPFKWFSFNIPAIVT